MEQTTVWTPAKRAITALCGGMPDEIPTFELEFQLSEEFFGYSLDEPRLSPENRGQYSERECGAFAEALADRYARVYGDKNAYEAGVLSGDDEKDRRSGLDYAIIPVYAPDWYDPASPITKIFRRRLREHFGNTRLFAVHGDGTFAIPDGNAMYNFAYRTSDDPDGLCAEARTMADNAIRQNYRQHEADIDVVLLCSDYCYNAGPFLSPAMFGKFIFPYLRDICEAGRADGLYVIKHTDGNIMPIIDYLVEAHPHALHSLDPMAGVDIRAVKRLYGDRVALCGNVHCAALQTGTDEEVRASAEYCLRYGGAGGGYIFATSNVPFRGMPPERYAMILDIWKQHRKYPQRN